MSPRVLYIDLAPHPGGSIISLAHLVKGLDRTPWRPMVILSRQNAFTDFETMGIEVARVRTPQWETSAAGKGDPGGEHSPAHEGGVGAWMRRGAYRAKLWHLGGDLQRWRRDILPVTQALLPLIRAFSPHLIHLNDAIPLVRHGILAARRAGVPVINHSRSFVRPNALDRRWLLPSLRGMIFISQAVARAQLQGVGSPPPYRVIPNPVDLAPFQHPAQPAQVRREFGAPPDAPLIGMAGRITRWKGQHVFIEALAHLRRRLPQAHGLILGEAGSARDQEYRRALQALSRELGLEPYLHWAGHRTDLPRILPALDALAHCSVEPEPFGRVIIEGMAAGVPVVASAAGGAMEIIDQGVNGLLTPPGDADALAAALTRLLRDASLRDRIIANGRRTVAERYTMEKHVTAVTEFYELVLSDSARSSLVR